MFVDIIYALVASSVEGDTPRTLKVNFENEYFKLGVFALYWIELRKIYCVLVV